MIDHAPVDPYLLEATDGILVVLLTIMAVFAVLHIANIWNECRAAMPPGREGFWRCIRGIYYERKPSIAIFVFTVALLGRFANFWHFRHLKNHNLPLDGIARYTTETFIAATVLLIVAVVCWIRNVSPYRIANWQWLIILALSAWFGIGMAM